MKRFIPKGARAFAVVLTALLVWSAPQAILSQTPAPTVPPAPTAPTAAPGQNPDWRALQDRVQQLEQELAELKKLMRPTLAAANVPAKAPTDVAVGENVALATPPAGAPGAAAKPAPDAEKSTIEIYGFAMLDAGFDFKTNDPDWFDVVRPTRLPSFGGQFAPDGKTFFGVRQSRLGVKASVPTRFGELKTTFEFELFGTGVDAGQTTFRLRHAYGELGQFGAGQYWTVFGDTDAYPNSIEYWGPNGLIWYRNVQIRWMPLKGRNSVTLALERPGASGDQGTFAGRVELAGIKPKFDLPDLTGNVRWNRDWGHLQIAGILRRIRWRDTIEDAVDFSGSAVGYGASVGGSLNFGDHDVVRLQGTYGTGIANYLNDAPTDVAARRTGNPARPIEGVAIPVFGMSAFLDHTWNKRFTSAMGYSMVNLQNSDGQAPIAYHRGQYALANLLFTPVTNAMVGGEVQWGRRQNAGDGYGVNDFRIQFSFKYNFSKVFTFASGTD